MSNLEKAEIIIIDDDSDIQDIAKAFFKQKGSKVTCFADAESALKEIKKTPHKWDVVITDLKLPHMSGVEFTIELKQAHSHIPVILITSTRSAETALEAVQHGAYDFIVKPIHFPQLQISVERALRYKAMNGDLQELRTMVKNPVHSAKGIIGKSPKFLQALDIAKRVAKSKSNIFIGGESGTGKEVFAKFIHQESAHPDGPFMAINCSAIPETLLESELFGHAKGSFTGAHEKKIGLFEAAENGTLFLDEIGDLSLSLQAKLLRVLQERKIKRVGENQFRAINCRIISATHKSLLNEIKKGNFREDLYFRLNVIPIHIPPLRERKEDLLPLAETFLRRFSLENGTLAKTFSKEAIKYILDNPWRGNVRELENTIERATVLSTGPAVQLEDLKPLQEESPALLLETSDDVEAGLSFSAQDTFYIDCRNHLPTLDEVTRLFIEFAVSKNDGARDKTAKQIGIDRKTLYKRLKEVHFSPQ